MFHLHSYIITPLYFGRPLFFPPPLLPYGYLNPPNIHMYINLFFSYDSLVKGHGNLDLRIFFCSPPQQKK